MGLEARTSGCRSSSFAIKAARSDGFASMSASPGRCHDGGRMYEHVHISRRIERVYSRDFAHEAGGTMLTRLIMLAVLLLATTGHSFGDQNTTRSEDAAAFVAYYWKARPGRLQ